MNDFFSLFQLEPRPFLDVDQLKEKFLERSTKVHPDKFHSLTGEEKSNATAQFTELNQAYQTLRDPKERIKHLIELDTGNRPADVQDLPPGAMELFFEIGKLCGEADQLLVKKLQNTSRIFQAMLLPKTDELRERLNQLLSRLTQEREGLLFRLQEIDREWILHKSQNRMHLAQQLTQLYRDFSFVSRWTDQIKERLLKLEL